MKYFLRLSLLLAGFFAFSSFSTNGWTDWGPWTHTDCFKKLDFRVKTKYSTTTKKYEAYVEWRNSYKEKIHFNFKITGGSYVNDHNRKDVKAGEVEKSWVGANYTSSKLQIEISRVRFGKDGLQEYAPCDP